MAARQSIHGDRLHHVTGRYRHHTPYLSASRLSLYAECPALYRRRYVDGVVDSPTIDMEYGQAIHSGLDTHFKGGDAEIAFLRDLHNRLEPLRAAGADPADWLVPQGLKLIADVVHLGWAGESERRFFWVADGFRVPFKGVIDLWRPDQNTVIDWKTTRQAWSDATPERYQFQRVIYAQAAALFTQRSVSLQFVALGAYPGGRMQIIEATPGADDVVRAMGKAKIISDGIEAARWACTCRDQKHLDTAA